MLVALGELFSDLCAGKFLAPCDVENSGLLFREQFPARASSEFSVDGRPEFVSEETQFLSALPCVANLLVESAIACRRDTAVERGADDGVARIREDDLFGGDFGFRINAQRIDCVSFDVAAFASIEDEIGGDENERDVRGEFSEQGCGFNVDPTCQLWIGLAIRRLGHCRAVDDAGGLLLAKHLANGGGVEQVKSLTSQTNNVRRWRELRRKLNEVIPDQSTCSGDPNRGSFL